MKKATKLRKKLILDTYRKDFPDIIFNDYCASVTLYNNGKIGMGFKEAAKLNKNPNYCNLGHGTFIHKSLIGIEDNNGWILIEPDGSNLPAKNDFVRWLDLANGLTDNLVMGNCKRYFMETFTHYKPVEIEKLPLY